MSSWYNEKRDWIMRNADRFSPALWTGIAGAPLKIAQMTTMRTKVKKQALHFTAQCETK